MTGAAIVAVVILIAALVLFSVHGMVRHDEAKMDDVKNMRRLYVAAVLYESQNDDLPPPSLNILRSGVDDSTFLASGDPFKDGKSFPIDPAFPYSNPRIDFRISFTYLPQWALHQKCKVPDWHAAVLKPSLGFLACYWYGPGSNVRQDGLDSSGEVVRINMDGSAKSINKRNRNELLDVAILFGTPATPKR
jgi:hypothetical protein